MTDAVAAVRRFNRNYTKWTGLLDEHLHASGFGLTEARVLYELAHRKVATASELVTVLGLDPGYLSRILKAFAKSGYIARERFAEDGRQFSIALTAAGEAAFRPLEAGSIDAVTRLLEALTPAGRDRLIDAMSVVEEMLGKNKKDSFPAVLRPPLCGDFGWIVHRHGALYHQEYGWNAEFEALVAEIVAKFIREFKEGREFCRVADKGGRVVGSVFLVQVDAETAKLRLLYVEPDARGEGLGRRLVEEAVNFARQAGYRRLTLWTNDGLIAARHIYEKAGFRLVGEEPHESFGHKLTGQYWELAL
ncbi:MarR family transcriptional regulator [Nordella sp. HKS 07]|uniref:bifunctional helix-turn-helix transcriptional regulator/GNAT family N-acetyltransferase n=1 Tax=Nordella sp. HKS 07 TaxID=2712222 RepID=UPI0013E1EBD4|nr:helix-turn-helix domain-containing GNAT family N-acetyltransferase [Nordella sp. HKS 07]QIG50929.1 MarR family transcriptional regulator [Nordella sp. HKS 07]